MLKKGCVDDDTDDDDEVRSHALQNRATATLSTEEFFLSTVFIALPSYQQKGVQGGGGQEIDSHAILIAGPQLGSLLPVRPPYRKTGFTKSIHKIENNIFKQNSHQIYEN
jgi:hypothetical protein